MALLGLVNAVLALRAEQNHEGKHMTKHREIAMGLRFGIGAALLASVAFVSGSAAATSAICSASGPGARQNATVTVLPQAPNVCIRVKHGTPAAPGIPDCWAVARGLGFSCAQIVTLESPMEAACSASGPGGRQNAVVSVSDRDPNICIRVKLRTPAAPGTPDCWVAKDIEGLGCTAIADLDSPAAAMTCSASGGRGGRQNAIVSVSDRDPKTCIRIKLGTQADAFTPSCFPVSRDLGCVSVVDLN